MSSGLLLLPVVPVLALLVMPAAALGGASPHSMAPAAAPAGVIPGIVVNSTNDPGDGTCDVTECTFREAIELANATLGTDTITFAIPSTGPHTIEVVGTQFPAVTETVHIDAEDERTAGGYPGIVLDGGRQVDQPLEIRYGLLLEANGGSVRGLTIHSFTLEGEPGAATAACGVQLDGSGWTIQGNQLGTNATGTGALENMHGLCIGGDSNLIGGTDPGQGNLSSGNRFQGIDVGSDEGGDGNIIQGNFLGTDVTGEYAIPNGGTGLFLSGAGSNVVGGQAFDGGDCDGACNLISGNVSHALQVQFNGSTNNVIQGNYIGTDISGTEALPNGTTTQFGAAALILGSSAGTGTIIGGTDPLAANLISGNASLGVELDSTSLSGSTIQGNLIGTDVSGKLALPNAVGVLIDEAQDTLLGGTESGAGNVISGNLGDGIQIVDTNATGNVVQGNHIGVDIDGEALGNGGDGVVVQQDKGGQLIGGTEAAAANVIAHNGGNGVTVRSRRGSAQLDEGTPILGNSIHSNGGLGIDLGAFDEVDDGPWVPTEGGVTENDPGDADEGGNGLQNFPDISSVVEEPPGSLRVEGTLDSTAATEFRLEFFLNAACDPSGNGEGAIYLGSAEATTDADGDAAFDATFQADFDGDDLITATATSSVTVETSEFSDCAPLPQTVDLDVDKTVDDTEPSAGETVVYEVEVTNEGPDRATGVELTDLLPDGLRYVLHNAGSGTYDPDTGAWIVGGTLQPGASRSLMIAAEVTRTGSITNTAEVSAVDQSDEDPSNDSGSVDIDGQPRTDFDPCRDLTPTHRGVGFGDTIRGTNGPDIIFGTPGPDLIIGLGDDDVLCGFGSDDVLLPGSGDDHVDGGAGRDRVVFEGDRGVVVHLGVGSALGPDTGADTLTKLEHVTGTQDDDWIRGDSRSNVLRGRGGEDFIAGGPGDDMLYGGSGEDRLGGNRGSDFLSGGSGQDRCNGGPDLDSANGSCESIRQVP